MIPKAIRDAVRWSEGTDVDVELENDVVTLRRVVPERRRATLEEVRRVAGILKYNGPPKSIAEMDKAVGDMFRREWKK